MRHIDVDVQYHRRDWSGALRPARPARDGGGPRTIAAPLRQALVAAGRLVDIALVAVTGGLVAAAAGQPALALGQLALDGLLVGHTAAVCFGYGLGQGLATRVAGWTRAARRVLVVGERQRALDVLAVLGGDRRGGVMPVGVILDRDPPPRPLLGGFITGLGDIERVVADEAVDDVVVALPWSDPERLLACLARLKPLAVDVHLFPDAVEPYLTGDGIRLLAGVPMAGLGSKPLAGGRAVAKAILDRGLALLLLVALAPLFLAIAVAIRLDSPGPVLFRQRRAGLGDQPFVCFKFRSMTDRPPEAEVRQATRDDPRVTRVGRLLRRTSLDELPQLFNVLCGEMSLVGPRPHALSHHHAYARLVDDYRCRHRMKPGLTGWAQVNGCRGETVELDQMRKRVRYDLWYIDHWSLWLDLLILARTPLACLKATNAY